MYFIAPLFADASQPAPNPFMQLVPFLGVLVVLYFFMIRPQSKKTDEHKKMLESLKKGSSVVTSSGLIGIIQKVDDSEIILEIAENVSVKVLKTSILSIYDGKLALPKTSSSKDKAQKNGKKESSKIEESTEN